MGNDLHPSQTYQYKFPSHQYTQINAIKWQNIHTSEDQLKQYKVSLNNQQAIKKYQRMFLFRRGSEYMVATQYLDLKDQQQLCSTKKQGNIYIEYDQLRLSDISDIPYPDYIHLYHRCLKAYQLLYEQYGAFGPEEEHICINSAGKVKAWIHSELNRDSPQHLMAPTAQVEMLRQLFFILRRNIFDDNERRISRFKSTVENNKTLQFANEALIRWCKSEGILIPQRLSCVIKNGLILKSTDNLMIDEKIIKKQQPNNERDNHLLPKKVTFRDYQITSNNYFKSKQYLHQLQQNCKSLSPINHQNIQKNRPINTQIKKQIYINQVNNHIPKYQHHQFQHHNHFIPISPIHRHNSPQSFSFGNSEKRLNFNQKQLQQKPIINNNRAMFKHPTTTRNDNIIYQQRKRILTNNFKNTYQITPSFKTQQKYHNDLQQKKHIQIKKLNFDKIKTLNNNMKFNNEIKISQITFNNSPVNVGKNIQQSRLQQYPQSYINSLSSQRKHQFYNKQHSPDFSLKMGTRRVDSLYEGEPFDNHPHQLLPDSIIFTPRQNVFQGSNPYVKYQIDPQLYLDLQKINKQ